jgi:hypothetical protein
MWAPAFPGRELRLRQPQLDMTARQVRHRAQAQSRHRLPPSLEPERQFSAQTKRPRVLSTAGRRYSIDYYQREYKWQNKQVTELMRDLTAKFLESYEPHHERADVAGYGHYFLGSIIISDKDGVKFIIDGQQRLTTLTLLLIYLQQQLEDVEQHCQLADLIFSQKYGRRSFNLDIPRADGLHGGALRRP